MNRLLCLLLATAPALPSFAASTGFELEPGLRALDPILQKQLAIYPVISEKPAGPPVQYLTLAAGLERKEVQVREKGNGGQVNEVQVTNKSARPLLLVGGEIILGGQQDRVMSQDVLVPPGKTKSVAVFCVEHGRWNGSQQFGRSGGMVDAEVKLHAKYNKDQSKVWEEVARKTAALKATSDTGTYRTLAEGSRGQEVMKPFVDGVKTALDKHPEKARMVGLITAVNGKLLSMDLFADPQLFALYRDRLVEAAARSAADQDEKPGMAQPKPEAIRAWKDKAEKARSTETKGDDGTRTVLHDADDVVGSELEGKNIRGQTIQIIRGVQAK
jgi:hypothetical protein